MKRSELLFNVFTIPLDIVMLLLAASTAFYSRLHTNLIGPVQYYLPFSEFLSTAYKVVPGMILIFALLGLYNLRGTRKSHIELGKIVLGVSVGLFIVIVLFFFRQTLFPSRFIVLAAWVYATVFVFVGRFVMQRVQKFFFQKGYGLHNLVIINGAGVESNIIEKMLKDKSRGYRVVKELHYADTTLVELEELFAQERIDEIIQANPTLGDDVNLKIVAFAKNKGIQFSFVPNLFDVQRNVVEVTDYNGIPVVSIKNTPLDGWGKVIKRLMDVLGSGSAMLMLSPIYLAVFLAVKLDSPGPAIYPYPRGGKGKDFTFYKFRSMYTHLSNGLGGEEANKVREELWKKNDRGGAESPFLKIKNDPRITRVGKFIRKTKLDELPQFWNVLKGDMSLVGPRAHMVDEVERYRNKYPRMFSIKPGIFGMSQNAQILNPELPFEEEIRINIYYIENWSWWLDVSILIKSFYLIFFGNKGKETY